MSNRASCVLPAICLALAGCNKAADQPPGKAAGAEVLPGTISDAMLNVDQSRAQPLLQPPPPPSTAAVVNAPSDAASDAAIEAPAKADAEPAPTN